LSLRQACIACSTIIVTLSAPSLHAGNTWDGGGSNALWGSANNWDPNGTPNYALALNFQGGTRTTTQNNRTAGSTVADINFTNDGTTGKTAAFTLQGPNATTTNSMTLGGNITTTASSSNITDTIHASLDIILNGDRTITTNTNHNLRISGGIYEDASPRKLIKEGVGQLVLDSTSLTTVNNSFSGGIDMNAGILSFTKTGAAGSGTITLGAASGSDTAELRLTSTGTNISNALTVRAGSSGTKTLANIGSNTVTYSGQITANDNLTILVNTNQITISNIANTIAAGKTVSFSNGNGNIVNSAIWGGDGSTSFTGSGNGNISVSGASTYAGGTTLGAMTGNGVVIAQANSVFTGTTLTSGAFGTGTLSIGATKMRGVTSGNITIGNAISFTDNPTFTTQANEKSLIFSGDATLGANRTLTVETGSTVASAAVEFSGEISGEISGSGFGITKEGAGNLVLSGTNIYDGLTTVSTGTLLTTKAAALPGYNAASKVSVASAATLAVRAGGSGEWVSTEIDDLLGATTAAFAADSNFGVEVTIGNTFTYANDIGATQAAKGLVKTGEGTLELSGTNTYTGATTINTGKLIIADGSIAASSNIVNNAALEYNLNANARTYANVISGSGTLTKSGTNSLTLSGLNSFSGNVTVNDGTLVAAVSGSGGNSALGGSLSAKTINVNTGGTLRFDVGNVFNNNFSSLASALPTLNIAGGTMTNSGSATNSALGNITLADGTLTATTGSPAGTASGQGYGSWNLNGTVTSTGTSLISSSAGAGIPITLNATNGLSSPATIFDVQSGTLTVSAVLGQVTRLGNETVGSLTKDGAGTMILSGTNTYTGETVIKAGTLKANTSTTIGSSSKITVGDTGSSGTVLDATTAGLTVGATQTLAGIGTVDATGQTVAIDGTLAPGNSAGTLSMTVGNLDLGNSTALAFELNPSDTTVGSSINDLVDVTGNLNLDGLLSVVATSGDFLSVVANTSWRLFNYSGTLTDDTLSLGSMPSLGSGLSWSIDTATSGQVNLVVIPEPRAALLGGLGLLALLRRRR
jgi:autotransporter-associated beta strand protein